MTGIAQLVSDPPSSDNRLAKLVAGEAGPVVAAACQIRMIELIRIRTVFVGSCVDPAPTAVVEVGIVVGHLSVGAQPVDWGVRIGGFRVYNTSTIAKSTVVTICQNNSGQPGTLVATLSNPSNSVPWVTRMPRQVPDGVDKDHPRPSPVGQLIQS